MCWEGSSINAQVYMRGRSEDYNEWNDILRINNNCTIDWDNVLPYFKSKWRITHKIENKYHSKKGRLKVLDSSC